MIISKAILRASIAVKTISDFLESEKNEPDAHDNAHLECVDMVLVLDGIARRMTLHTEALANIAKRMPRRD